MQETRFPEEEGTTIVVKTRGPATAEMALNLRIPGWAARGVTVALNGAPQQVTATPATYVTLKRVWKDGDKIQLRLPMSLHTESIPDDPTLQAVLYGPLVLAGRLGKQGLTRELTYGPLAPDSAKPIPVPRLTISKGMAAESVEAVRGEPLSFRTVGQPNVTRLSPLFQVFDERYTVYWKTAR